VGYIDRSIVIDLSINTRGFWPFIDHSIPDSGAREAQVPEMYRNAKRIFDVVINSDSTEQSGIFGGLYIAEAGGTATTSTSSLDALLKTVDDVNHLSDFVVANYIRMMVVNSVNKAPTQNPSFPTSDEIIIFAGKVHRLYFSYCCRSMMRQETKEVGNENIMPHHPAPFPQSQLHCLKE
jgi:hypothetical protein